MFHICIFYMHMNVFHAYIVSCKDSYKNMFFVVLFLKFLLSLIGDSYVVEAILKMLYKALVGMDCSGCCTVQ